MKRRSVDDYGDDYGLRVARIVSSTVAVAVAVAVVVHRNAQEKGGVGNTAANPHQEN